MPVLDWAAGRRSYAKIGASRDPKLAVVSLADLHDPASNVDSIMGKRDRVLTQAELKAVLPLLTYPAPSAHELRLKPEDDYRPIAMRFLLFTAARRGELESMQ